MTSPINDIIMEGTIADSPPDSSVSAKSSPPSLVNMLAFSCDFQPALDGFLARHPHHEPLREVLGTASRLACIACAALCTSMLGERHSIDEVIDDLKARVEGGFESAVLDGSGTEEGLSEEDASCVMDYLRAFDYVYQRRQPEGPSDQTALSSLSTIGYLATRGVLERNHRTSLHYTEQILHELILPLLNTVFQSVTGRESPSN